MDKCAFCKTEETALYESGLPICLKCVEKREPKRKPPNPEQIRTTLVGRISDATALVSKANQEFSESIGKFPSGLPHPDGIQQIRNASNKLDLARKEMMTAHKRLNDFIERGIVPEELKRSGG
jgi:hypothetical protein